MTRSLDNMVAIEARAPLHARDADPFCVLGVDCGVTGALAFYWPQFPQQITVEDMPRVGKDIDVTTLAQRIAQMRPDVAVVEAVHAMPKNGSIAGFKLGMAYGAVRGAIAAAGIPLYLIAASKWKRKLGLSADKEGSRDLAMRMWPHATCFNRVKDHNRAEASLLARHGVALCGVQTEPVQ